MECKVIDFQKEKEKVELKSFLKLLKLGKMVEISKDNIDGIDSIYEFNVRCLGFCIGNDLITFSKDSKIYPVNLEIKDELSTDDVEPGIYVTDLTDIDDNNLEYVEILKNNLDIARNLVKRYVSLFNNRAIEYDTNSEELLKYDRIFVEYSENINCPVLKFKKNK